MRSAKKTTKIILDNEGNSSEDERPRQESLARRGRMISLVHTTSQLQRHASSSQSSSGSGNKRRGLSLLADAVERTPTNADILKGKVKIFGVDPTQNGENHHSLQKSDSELEYSPGDLTAMTDNASVSGISELTKKKKKGVFSSLRVPKALKGKSHKKKHDLDDSTSAMADSASRDLRFTDSFSDQDFQALRQRLEESESQKLALESERDHLQEILESRQTTIEQLRTEIEQASHHDDSDEERHAEMDLRRELQARSTEVEQLKKEMEINSKALKDAREEVASLRVELTERDEAIAILKSAQEKSAEEKVRMERNSDELDRLRRQIESLMAENLELKNRTRAAEQLFKETQLQMAEARERELTDAQRDLLTERDAAIVETPQLLAMKNRAEAMKDRDRAIEDRNQAVIQRDKELAHAHEELADAQKERDAAKTELDDVMRAQDETTSGEVKQLGELLQSMERQLAEASEKHAEDVHELTAEHQRLLTNLRSSHEQSLRAYQAGLASLVGDDGENEPNQQVTKVRELLGRYMTELEESQIRLNDVETQLLATEQQLASSKHDLTALQEKSDALEEDSLALQKTSDIEHKQLLEGMAEKDSRCEQLTRELEELQRLHLSSQSETSAHLAALQAEHTKVQAEHAKVQAEHTEICVALEACEAKLTEELQLREKITAERDELISEIGELKNACEKFGADCEIFEENNNNLKTRVRDHEENLEGVCRQLRHLAAPSSSPLASSPTPLSDDVNCVQQTASVDDDLRADWESLKKDLHLVKEQLNESRKKVKLAQEEKDRALDMAIETEKEMMDARAEAAEARHEAGLRVEEAVRASEVAVQTLEAEKASLLQKRRDLETNLERLSEENHQLKQRVLHLSSDDDEARKHLMQEVEDARGNEQKMREELDRQRSALETAEHRLSEVTGRLESSEKKLKSSESMSRSQLTVLQQEDGKLKGEVSRQAKLIERLKATETESQSRIEELEQQAAELESAKMKVEQKISRIEKEYKECMTREGMAKESLKQSNDEVSRLQQERRELMTKVSEKSVEEQKVTQELDLLKMQYNVLQSTHFELQDQVASLTVKTSQMNKDWSSKEAELHNELSDLTKRLQDEKSRGEAALTKHMAELTGLKKELSQFKSDLANADIERNILERRNAQLQELNDELKKTSSSVLQDTLKTNQQTNLDLSNLKVRAQQLERENCDLVHQLEMFRGRMSDTEKARQVVACDFENSKAALKTMEEDRRVLENRCRDSELQLQTLKVKLQEAFQREEQLMRETKKGETSAESVVNADQPPSAKLFSNAIASLGESQSAVKVVRTPDGIVEVVMCLKQRLLDCMFETFARRPTDPAVLGGIFQDVLNQQYARSSMKEAEKKPEVLRVLSRVKKLWQLSEDMRLALVQSDSSLAELYQQTKTTNADWDSTLEALKGSAQVIEQRNQELERLAAGYSSALEEARMIGKMDREKAKTIVSGLKRKLQAVEEARAKIESDRDKLVEETNKLRGELENLHKVRSLPQPVPVLTTSHRSAHPAAPAQTYVVSPPYTQTRSTIGSMRVSPLKANCHVSVSSLERPNAT